MIDKKFDVAVGLNRKTKKWKNIQMAWPEITGRLKEVVRTQETMAEYKAMGTEQKSDIKDVGGFVGGYLANGSRTSVDHRSLICLDADFADSELWNDFKKLEILGACYSTHTHTKDKPRLRLVIPIDRNVELDEYQAIARRIADLIGIDKFDDTTYQPQRMMYWPSCSRDGEYVFEEAEGEILKADDVLSSYHDWTDVSSWPMSSRVAHLDIKRAEKAENPTEKKGIVGIFCRAYSITEAIAEFIDDYQPCDENDRYTYIGGSTAAGVITYEDKFSYSHHATDPASMMLCNSFDLVRLHKFGHLDKDVALDTKVDKRPSYKAMVKFANEDKKVKRLRYEEAMAGALEDFSDEEVETDNDWTTKLRYTEKGGLAQRIENAVLILENEPLLKKSFGYNQMENSITVLRKLPWNDKYPRQWSDADDANLRYWLESGELSLSGKDRIFDAVNIVAQENAFHPVKEYLDTCEWDGVERLDSLLIDYLGAEDNEYTRAVTRKSLVAAVARIYNPGCKFDYMLTLRGSQGIGKSALIAKLGGEWFSDTFTTMTGKEAYEQTNGVWIMEIGELAGMKKAEAETIKLFISKQKDRYRPAYGRRTQEFPRQCIFIGTTNESQFLRDATGNRRFWVVDTPNEPTKSIWDDLTDEEVKRIWGEAKVRFKEGEQLFLSRELEAIAREVQEAYEEENPKAGLIMDYLNRGITDDWDMLDVYQRREWIDAGLHGTEERRYVCTMEIWAEVLKGNPDRIDRYASKEIREILLKTKKWKYKGDKLRTIPPYGRQRYFERID